MLYLRCPLPRHSPWSAPGLGARRACIALSLTLTVTLAAASADLKPVPGNLEVTEPAAQVEVIKELQVPMRDGVRLAADLYRPKGATAPLPTILIRTPYSKDLWPVEDARFFAGHGFAVIVQDFRGRFKSEGLYHITRGHRQDGYDTFAWIVKQPWSTGKIGTYGCSYLGEVQLYQAPAMPPGLSAMIPQASGTATGSAGHYYKNASDMGGGAWELAIEFDWFYKYASQLFYGPRQPSLITDENRATVAGLYSSGPTIPSIDYAPVFNTLPIVDMMKQVTAPPNEWVDWVTHNLDLTDPWWSQYDFVAEGEKIPAPALFIESWNDISADAALYLRNMFERTATTETARHNQFAIISPASHCESESMSEHQYIGDQYVGDPRFGHHDIYLKWFKHWLADEANHIEAMPKIQYYVIGANQWKASNTWPIAGTRFIKWYLAGGGHANSHFGDGELDVVRPSPVRHDSFDYDPTSPVPSAGENDYMDSKPIVDQRVVSARSDVLVYTSKPLHTGFEMTGEIEVVLYVQSSARDTDFTAKLVDVDPSGAALNVRENLLRARYRQGRDKPATLMVPGEVYRLDFKLGAYSLYFPKGHRIRLQVTSSSFPRYDRNLNTGGNNFEETSGVVAHNRIFHGGRFPSSVVLPVIPE